MDKVHITEQHLSYRTLASLSALVAALENVTDKQIAYRAGKAGLEEGRAFVKSTLQWFTELYGREALVNGVNGEIQREHVGALFIAGHPVDFNNNGSSAIVTVGCWNVDKESAMRILKRVGFYGGKPESGRFRVMEQDGGYECQVWDKSGRTRYPCISFGGRVPVPVTELHRIGNILVRRGVIPAPTNPVIKPKVKPKPKKKAPAVKGGKRR